MLLALTSSAATWWIATRRPATDARSLGPTITRVTADSGTHDESVGGAERVTVGLRVRSRRQQHEYLGPTAARRPAGSDHLRERRRDQPDFSPDGSRIAFRSERNGGGIYVVPALGGAERFVAPKGRHPRFSPDGKSIAYVTGGRGASTQLWVVDEGGASPRRLEMPGFGVRDSSPLWSPDGAFLAVAATRGRDPSAIRDWWRIKVQDGSATAMSVAATFERAGLSSTGPAAWVNGEILFSARTGDVSSLWAIGLSSDELTVTGAPRRLTAGVGTDAELSVARAANDGAVYYVNKDERANLYRLPLSGSPTSASLERVTEAAATDAWPAVSADGRTLVFFSNRSSDSGAWSRDLASGREAPLNGTAGGWPTLSPDGQRVAYAANPQAPWNFVTGPIGGGATERLPDDVTRLWSWPSPTVLFAAARVGDILELRIVDPTSGKARPALADLKPGSYGHGQLSPDGRWASAMEWSSADRARIIIFPFRATPVPSADWIALTEEQSVEQEHVWSPQGDAIYFVSERDGSRCVWLRKLDPATMHPVGAVTPVLHLHGARRSIIQPRQSAAHRARGWPLVLQGPGGARQHLEGHLQRKLSPPSPPPPAGVTVRALLLLASVTSP